MCKHIPPYRGENKIELYRLIGKQKPKTIEDVEKQKNLGV